MSTSTIDAPETAGGKVITMMKYQDYPISVELVTPDTAAEWLTLNVENRKIIRQHVEGLVRNMKANEYVFNANPISFGHIEVDGVLRDVLFDGQHRLTAIVKSGCAQHLLVVRNISAKAHRTIDINRVRTLAHHLQFDHYKNSTSLGTTLNIIWAYDNGALRIRSAGSTTKIELYGLLEGEPEIAESVNFVTARRSPVFNASDASAIHRLVWREAGRELADQFIDALRNDIGLQEGDPILVFQRWSRNATAAQKNGVPRADRMAVLIKCFNYWARGDLIKQLRWRHGYEDYPAISVPSSMREVPEQL